MAKLYNTPVELLVLRGLCSRDRKVSGTLLSQVDETCFHNEESVEAFNRVLKVLGSKGETPPYKLLCEDVGLSEETRLYLTQVDGMIKTVDQARQTLDLLHKYRQTRILYSVVKGVQKHLEASKVDIDDVVEFISSKMSAVQNRKSIEETLFHIGKNSNVADLIDDILNGEDNDSFIPTGFAAWDTTNGGLPRGGLITIGGSSGAGKSHMLGQMAKTQAELGYKVLLVPLEMDEREQLIRLLANLTSLDSLKFSLKQLASGEKELAEKRFARYERKVAKSGGRLSIFRPQTDMSIEEILAAGHSFNPDIIYIDYISLLKGASGEDQWRKLGDIARYGKVYAGNHKKVVVLAAQVNEDGKLKYSQTIREHSNTAWVFVATKESREKGHLNIDVLKSRNQNGRPFTLKVDYAHSHIYDLPSEEMQATQEAEKKIEDSLEAFMPDLSAED